MMGQIRPQAEATFERTNAKISDHRLSLLSPAVAWFRAASLAGNRAAIDSPGQLSQWRHDQLAAGSAEALAARKAEQAETQRLRREVKRLEEEVEILRKAAAFSLGGSRDQVCLCGS
jgi:hypothetical protein